MPILTEEINGIVWDTENYAVWRLTPTGDTEVIGTATTREEFLAIVEACNNGS